MPGRAFIAIDFKRAQQKMRMKKMRHERACATAREARHYRRRPPRQQRALSAI